MTSDNELVWDICNISTKDNKTYTINLNPNMTWSDGTNITINDVFFTYYDIVKSNQWGLTFLDSYSKLEITQNDDGTIVVVFPRESIDNQLFFLNPILPARHLTNQTLTYYQTQFASKPIMSACASIKPQTTDKMSTIFDLSRCSEYVPQILQVKQFSNNTDLESYIKKNPGIIDYVIDWNDTSLTQHNVTSTQAIISYFHVNTISDNTRKQLALLFNSAISLEWSQLEDFVPYDGIFAIKWLVDRNTLRRNLGILKDTTTTWTNTTWATTQPTTKTQTTSDNDIPLLTKNILAYWSNKYKTAYLPAQDSKFTILFKFDQEYDKIAISANGPYKYFPDSYKSSSKTAEYNLSTAFNNLVVWKNTYVIRWYKGDQAISLLTLTIYYNKKPNSNTTQWNSQNNNVITNLDGTRTIRVIYVEHPVINAFITQLQTLLKRNNLLSNFNFTSVKNISQLEDVVSSKSYEVIIKPMDLWVRNDRSILVHDDPMINNAQYKNQTLKNYLAELNQAPSRTKQKIITSIQEIYNKDTPFMILGNTVEHIMTDSKVQWSPDKDTSITNIRDQILNNVTSSHSLKINSSLLRDPHHLFKFLIGSHAN